MQSSSSTRRLRLWFALVCMLAVFVVSGVQVAHACGEDAGAGPHQFASSAQNSDGPCPICYSVPVGHGAAPTAIVPVRVEGSIHVAPIATQSAGIQPEFHLHIRPPPITT